MTAQGMRLLAIQLGVIALAHLDFIATTAGCEIALKTATGVASVTTRRANALATRGTADLPVKKYGAPWTAPARTTLGSATFQLAVVNVHLQAMARHASICDALETVLRPPVAAATALPDTVIVNQIDFSKTARVTSVVKTLLRSPYRQLPTLQRWDSARFLMMMTQGSGQRCSWT